MVGKTIGVIFRVGGVVVYGTAVMLPIAIVVTAVVGVGDTTLSKVTTAVEVLGLVVVELFSASVVWESVMEAVAVGCS